MTLALVRDWARTGAPDLVHAHFWMSGLAARRAAEAHRIPVVQTFHALGAVKRRHQGAADTSPAGPNYMQRLASYQRRPARGAEEGGPPAYRSAHARRCQAGQRGHPDHTTCPCGRVQQAS